MTARYQVCIGPSANKPHIRRADLPDEKLTLCERTVWVRDYKAALDLTLVCVSCARNFVAAHPKGFAVTAETLGVSELVINQ